jgi:hypothetical protein
MVAGGEQKDLAARLHQHSLKSLRWVTGEAGQHQKNVILLCPFVQGWPQ